MYCKHCGKEIADDSKFCQHCGGKQDILSDSTKNVESDTKKESTRGKVIKRRDGSIVLASTKEPFLCDIDIKA